jgi:serine protease AprX
VASRPLRALLLAMLALAPAAGALLGQTHQATTAAAPMGLPPGVSAPAALPWPAPTEGWVALAAAERGPAPLPPRVVQASPLLCILDTGVDAAHADLDGGKVVAWADFLGGAAQPFDDNGHGTHVAATAAGSGEAGPAGAAPYARLAVGRVMDGKGSGTTGAAAQGIAWCLAQGARVINLSLEEKDCRGQRNLAEAVDRAWRQGALVVTTAGNRGSAECAIHSPGSLAKAFTVGALAGQGLDAGEVARFSGRGAPGQGKPDLVAPGQGIRAAAAGTHLAVKAMDGTSMAAPYVAAVAALLLEAVPQASPQALADALRSTARDGGPEGHDPAWGWGAIDPAAALAWLEQRAAARALPS